MDWSPETETNRRTVLGAVGTALAATAGCVGSAERPERSAADWPQSGYDGGNTWYKPEGSPPVNGATVAWTADVDAGVPRTFDRATRTGLAINGDRAYTADGSVLDIEDGRVRQESPCFADAIVGFARTNAYDDGVLVTKGRGDASSTGFDTAPNGFHGYRPSVDTGPGGYCGNGVRWTAGAPEDFEWAGDVARIVDGTIYAEVEPSSEKFPVLVAVDADDGRVEWRASAPTGRLCVDGDWVYAHTGASGDDPGTLAVLSDGSVERTVETGTGNTLVAARDGVAYLQEGHVDADPSLTAVDAASGDRTALLGRSSPAREEFGDAILWSGDVVVGPETLFVVIGLADSAEQACLALNRDDGSVTWAERSNEFRRLTGTEQALYLTGTRDVTALDPDTGEQLWLQSPNVHESGRPVVGDTRLFVPGEDVLVAMEAP